MVRPSQSNTVDDFRKTVNEFSKVDNEVIVVSYSRKALGQTGNYKSPCNTCTILLKIQSFCLTCPLSGNNSCFVANIFNLTIGKIPPLLITPSFMFLIASFYSCYSFLMNNKHVQAVF